MNSQVRHIRKSQAASFSAVSFVSPRIRNFRSAPIKFHGIFYGEIANLLEINIGMKIPISIQSNKCYGVRGLLELKIAQLHDGFGQLLVTTT